MFKKKEFWYGFVIGNVIGFISLLLFFKWLASVS